MGTSPRSVYRKTIHLGPSEFNSVLRQSKIGPSEEGAVSGRLRPCPGCAAPAMYDLEQEVLEPRSIFWIKRMLALALPTGTVLEHNGYQAL